MSFFKGISKKQAISWALFDFANSSYSLLVMTFVFPLYFRDVIAGGGSSGDFWWGLTVSISILLGGILSPLVGAVADADQQRKRKFVIFSLLSMLGTIALFFTDSISFLFAVLLFIGMNVCFEIALSLYDSFLLHVSTSENSGRISGVGWGLGYVGGIVSMILLRPFYSGGYAGDLEEYYLLTFPLTGAFFFLFSLPAFFFLKEHYKSSISQVRGLLYSVREGVQSIVSTLRNIRSHKRIAWFLLGWYILNDGLVTIFSFVPIYAKTTLGMSVSEIGILLLIVQVIGFPSAIFFGWLSDHHGSKKILLLTISLWALVVVVSSMASSPGIFYGVSIITGFIIGSSQAVARSWFSKIIPVEKRSEFFGFNGFASKIAATTGPLIFGVISVISGSQRIAMIALLPYFAISFFIFSRIRE